LPPLTPASAAVATPSATVSPPSVSSTSSATLKGTSVTVKRTYFLQDNKEVLRVRAEPDSLSAEIGFVPVGEKLPYLKESKDGWVKVQFNQKVGWVSQQFVEMNQ